MSIETDDYLGGWELIADYPGDFSKWAYRKRDGDLSPLRVIADVDDRRGHARALYTSVYGPTSVLIRGNLGGGQTGHLRAVLAAETWMGEHPWGAKPPNQW
jgi:hypothetical protein